MNHRLSSESCLWSSNSSCRPGNDGRTLDNFVPSLTLLIKMSNCSQSGLGQWSRVASGHAFAARTALNNVQAEFH